MATGIGCKMARCIGCKTVTDALVLVFGTPTPLCERCAEILGKPLIDLDKKAELSGKGGS